MSIEDIQNAVNQAVQLHNDGLALTEACDIAASTVGLDTRGTELIEILLTHTYMRAQAWAHNEPPTVQD